MNLVKLMPLVNIVDLLDHMDELWISFDKQLMNSSKQWIKVYLSNQLHIGHWAKAGLSTWGRMGNSMSIKIPHPYILCRH